ncbi:olfactory receptor class A-like protein 4 [Pangasianodon hypophthalmus]|uniref:olfactory receptor class A-like protein 4 n=1 Tax=Pangasianodon hypophthalmus TaxID=310915 RepID=UPI000EFFEABD|nr:olfactory receptor class A-like protein 4 [Pangasianodon hypophthalmus]
MAEVLTLDAVLFGILVFSGILGNMLVIYTVVLCAMESTSHHMPPSDLILLNLSLANLLTSLFRTVPIFISDLGLEVSLETNWCRVFMLLWVWWRSVGSWATLALSIFHYTTLRRKHVAIGPLAQKKDRRRVILALGLVWGVNLVFSLPAAIYSTHVHGNATSELMVISCTTRPLLGCMWEFPSRQQGTAFASTSLALNEVLPLLLMVTVNLATLRALAKHIRMVTAGVESGAAHVHTERKAGHVIMTLVALFVVCWVMQVAAVTYYNYDGGVHTEGLLTVSQFAASVFVGFSPIVVALGHGKLRKRIVVMVQELLVCAGCRTTNTEANNKKRALESTTISYKQETQTKKVTM